MSSFRVYSGHFGSLVVLHRLGLRRVSSALLGLGEILNVDLGKVEKFLITAVLISFLSGSLDLATLYLIAQRPARSSHPGP